MTDFTLVFPLIGRSLNVVLYVMGTGIVVLALSLKGGLGCRDCMLLGGYFCLLGGIFQSCAMFWGELILGRIMVGVGISFTNAVRMRIYRSSASRVLQDW